MTEDIKAPVLIVGRGPVGMTLALLLARYGVATIVVDPQGRDIQLSSKAVLMHGESLEVLDRAGVGAEIGRTGTPLRGSRVFVGERQLRFDAFPAPDPSGYPLAINFPQSETERLLLQAVDREPLVDLRLGVSFTSLEQDKRGVVAELTGKEGKGQRVTAEYLVGCDGARSAVRKELDIAFRGHAHHDHYLIVDIKAELPYAEERRFYFHPPGNAGRTMLIHPQPNKLWHLDFQVGRPPNLQAEQRDGTLNRRIRAAVGDCDYELIWSTSYVFKQLMAERFSVGRCFLAGDAAHLYAPYGARGLNSGLADVDNLAWKIALVTTEQAAPQLLDSYHIERHAVAQHHFRITADTAAFMAPTTRRGVWRRDLTLAVAKRVPTLRRFVDSGVFYQPIGYPNSPLTKKDEPSAPTIVEPGQLMPDLPADASTVENHRRLRDFYCDRFLAIYVPSIPAPANDSGAKPLSSGVEWLPDPLLSEVVLCTTRKTSYPGVAVLDVPEALLVGRLLGQPRHRTTTDGGAAFLVRPDGHVASRIPIPAGHDISVSRQALSQTARDLISHGDLHSTR